MSDSQSMQVRAEWWSRPLGFIVWLLITILCWTLRFTVRFEDPKVTPFQDKQFIVVLWHNRTLVPCYMYTHMVKNRRPMCMITSASKDGAMLTQVAKGFGMKTVRGSSHRRGATAFLGMLRALKEGSCLCIAPDGPRGPIYKCKPGIVKLASKSGVPVVTANLSFSSYWRVRSAWDQYIIPKPFSRVDMLWGREIFIPEDLSDEESAEYLELLNKELSRSAPDFEGVDDPFHT